MKLLSKLFGSKTPEDHSKCCGVLAPPMPTKSEPFVFIRDNTFSGYSEVVPPKKTYTKAQGYAASLRKAQALEPRIRELIQNGATMVELQLEFKKSYQTMSKYIRILGLEEPKRKNYKPDPRAEEMMEMRKAGKSLVEVGEHFGVTRERVRQILVKSFPEVTHSIRRRTEGTCSMCGNPAVLNQNGTCSAQCSALSRNRHLYDRNDAEKIMRLRREGMTWEDVKRSMRPDISMSQFRASLQRYIPILWNTAEISEIFPVYYSRRQ